MMCRVYRKKDGTQYLRLCQVSGLPGLHVPFWGTAPLTAKGHWEGDYYEWEWVFREWKKQHLKRLDAQDAEQAATLREMLGRMDRKQRERFNESRIKYKPNLRHDLFVASLHIPIRAHDAEAKA